MSQDRAKRNAAEEAVKFVKDGMIVGLGTGSTAKIAVDLIGEKLSKDFKIKGMPTSIFKKNFGADAVLFVTISKWDTNYAVLAANVSVGMEYVMLSTTTNEILWQYSSTIVVDTSGQSTGFILADILSTAITTATTDYVPIAKNVNSQAFVALPHGIYSKQHRIDGDQNVVYKILKDAATE